MAESMDPPGCGMGRLNVASWQRNHGRCTLPHACRLTYLGGQAEIQRSVGSNGEEE